MGRHKINQDNKCITHSISVIPKHNLFLKQYSSFNLSSFVQICLEEHINNFEDFREIERRLNK